MKSLAKDKHYLLLNPLTENHKNFIRATPSGLSSLGLICKNPVNSLKKP
jgi:hypothetical protein